ncbi:MAG: SulP family inorganic anion transporter [Phycisphaerales bacterium]|nr:MAG: SulP family inorganic anion transporter [Phycisphaerales bacterium]
MLNFFRKQQQNIKSDVLSGLTVALALVPEAVAFAFVLGVSPIIGLYSAFFVGLVASLVGGRPGMISGATGAMAVVVVSLVAIHGIEYLFPAVVLCGLIQTAVGIGRLGKLIRMVPHPVLLGFVNGLAIVIAMSQIGSFKIADSLGRVGFVDGPALWIMLSLVAVTMAIIWLLPKLTRAVPASLVAIVFVSGLAYFGNQWLDKDLAPEGNSNVVLTVGDMLMNNARADAAAGVIGAAPGAMQADIRGAIEAIDPSEASLAAGLPKPFFLEYALPPITFETLWIIAPFALILAAVGLIESLMTMTLIDEITDTRGRGNRECIGQGAANITCGFFGGMGGCAMIGQSLINVNSGGRGRLSGVSAACFLLLFMLFLSGWIEMIPIAALVGVMFMVVIGTFEWASLRMFGRMPGTDMLVMVVVTGYTAIMHDLATAVIIGIILSALCFAWEQAKHIGVDIKHNEFGAKIYQLHGPLFFASTTAFKRLFDPQNDPDDVVIDFYYTRVYDQSGLEAINSLAEKYSALGKRLHLTHLSPECRQLLGKAEKFVVVNMSEDPQYHVASDRLA